MALRVVRVAVLGCPSGVLGGNSSGVGKSSLCNRFLHQESYSEEHPSCVSVEEWEGSVINEDHFLYWGSATKFCACTGRVRFQVLEYTEFINQETGRIFPYRTDYISRACEPFKSARKVAYTTEQAPGSTEGTEETYNPFMRRRSSGVATQVLFEEGSTEVAGYIVAFDPTLSEESGALQRQIEFLLSLLDELSKLRKPIVIACTKCDSSDSTRDSIRTGKVQLTAKRRHVPFVETSAREFVNVEEVFFTLVLNMKRSRKALGPLFVKKGGTSHNEGSTYKEVEYSRRKELRKARSAFQEVLRNRVVDFYTYWEETRPELEGGPEYQRLLELEEPDTLRKMFCNRLMEIKLEQARSSPSLSAYVSTGSLDCMEERMKYSQTTLKEAIASHPDLDSSAIYDFIRPSPVEGAEVGREHTVVEREQNGHEVDRSVKRSSSLAASESGLSQSLPAEEQGSDVDLDAGKESRNPFKHRSKSYIFSRGNKVKHNASTDRAPPSLAQEKKDWSSIAVFGTLPHKDGKKKKSKKAGKLDKELTRLSEPLIDFEDYGQYSEENPPPLPPRPQLPPLHSPHPTPQLSSNVDSNGLMWATTLVTSGHPHRALETSPGVASGELEEEESSLDFIHESAPREDASPYEVPVALQAPAVRRSETARPGPRDLYSQVRKTADRGTIEPPPRALHASFRQADSTEDVSNMSQKIGLRQLITDSPPHPLVPPAVKPQARRRHKRAGSYDPSLLRSVKQVETPPTLPNLSYQYPAKSVSSVQTLPPPLPAKGRRPIPLHSTPHLESEVKRVSTLPVQNNSSVHHKSGTRFFFPQSTVADISQQVQVLPESNMHSRQASLPDFSLLDPARESTGLPMGADYSNTAFNGPPDHIKRPPMMLPGRGTSSKLTTQVRTSLKSSSEGLGSELGPSPKSSSEERDYAVERVREKRRSILSEEGNLYEQIDDDALHSILGRDVMQSPFPRPLYLSDANLDADAIHEIQQWHLGFIKCYTSWMRDLDAIVQRSEQRRTPSTSQDGRPAGGSHKDSGTSTSLSREELTEPPDGPAQDPPPPSAAHPAKVPTPTSQSSLQNAQPAAVTDELWADTESAPSTVQALPKPQEETLVVHPKLKADAESRGIQQQQHSVKTADENKQQQQQYCTETSDEGKRQQSILPARKPEQQKLTKKLVLNECQPQQQHRTRVHSADRVSQQRFERTAAEGSQWPSEKMAGGHPGGYDHLVGFNSLYNGATLSAELSSPRKVSLV